MSSRHERLMPDLVRPRFRGRFGTPYLWSEECTSTQDVLRDADLPEGAVAVTEHQTGGRGREGRVWTDTPSCGLLCSLLLRPPPSPSPQQLSLVAGLAVAEAIETVVPALRCGLKWPNDVLVNGRKVAGVLLEATGERVVCGIGVNVNQSQNELPPATRVPATSLRVATACSQDRAALLVELLTRLEARYDAWRADGLEGLISELRARDALRGRPVSVGSVSGKAAGIAADGRLRIVDATGRQSLVAGGEVEAQVPG